MVYLFLADGFEEMEALVPLDILRRAGIQVTTVGVTGDTVHGAHGINVESDSRDAALTSQLEMIILPGGSRGVENLKRSGLVRHAVEYCSTHNIPIAAICAAPTLLAEQGILSSAARVTCFPDLSGKLGDACFTGDSVCVDGNIVTGKSAGHSQTFGLKLVEVLRGKEAASETEEAICQNG